MGEPAPAPSGARPAGRSAVEQSGQPNGFLEVTVAVRWIPFVPAPSRTSTWVARPARTTLLPPTGDGTWLGQRVRPVPSDPPP
jgi:hypothetical protein